MRLRRSPTPQPSVHARPDTTDTAIIAAEVERASRTMPQDRRLIVFESMAGRQYSDSPRAIYEELVRQDVDAIPLWSVRRGATGFPSDVTTVTRRSPEWIEALATAAVWVDNQGFARWLPKPGRVHYLQTWHGTPLKKMGWNDTALASLDPSSAHDLQTVYDRWDAVTTPSEYFVETIVDAFRSGAEVLRVGMPRNDILVKPLSDAQRDERLARVGLRADAHTVLFAPTRTADAAVSRARWDAAEAIAGVGVHVMYRGHYKDAPVSTGSPSSVLDVSAVPDMADLLVIADILVTDYSSSMFDFALTDRPIILFQPDQATYVADRGTYFDIRESSPGPIATTSEALVTLIRTVELWAPDWSGARADYRRRFGEYEAGNAAERVVREHLVPRLGYHDTESESS